VDVSVGIGVLVGVGVMVGVGVQFGVGVNVGRGVLVGAGVLVGSRARRFTKSCRSEQPNALASKTAPASRIITDLFVITFPSSFLKRV
jgi:tetrahydrodipicolinate N-succinyltransferase